MSLKSKNIVITGGSGSLGTLISKRLLALGAQVTVVDRSSPSVQAHYIESDLSTLDGINAIAEQLVGEKVDVLINLAGVQFFGPMEEQSPGNVELHYTINLLAPVLLTQAVLPQMKQRHSGQIVNIGSIFGSINFAHFITYSSTKAGLKGFSEALRREVRAAGISVTYIAPRAINTPFNGEKVLEYAALTNMKMDAPQRVAKRIVRAIRSRKKDVYIGFPESIFVRLNALVPRLVDLALASNDHKASALFKS